MLQACNIEFLQNQASLLLALVLEDAAIRGNLKATFSIYYNVNNRLLRRAVKSKLKCMK